MELTTTQLPEGITLPKDAVVYLQNEGYLRIRYADPESGSNRFVMLHRYIFEAVHGPIPDGYIVHHVDGDPLNNRLDNLMLMTRKGHSTLHRLNPDLGSDVFKAYWAKNYERLSAYGRKRRQRPEQAEADLEEAA